MPRRYGGRSALGSELNQLGGAQDGIHMTRIKYDTGVIVSFPVLVDGNRVESIDPKADGLYEFKVRLKNGKKTGWLSFVGTTLELAEIGHPSQMIGKFCYFMFEGQSSDRGKIISLVDDTSDPSVVGSANQLQIAGAAFAPPGSGMI